jgi:hypothetical protein
MKGYEKVDKYPGIYKRKKKDGSYSYPSLVHKGALVEEPNHT